MYIFNKLDNGIRVVLEKLDFVRSVSFGVFVRCGSRNENIDNNGVSHFIEHMLFKGTANRTAKELAEQTDIIGGNLNAYTAKEYTCIYTRVLDYHFENALDIISDMINNSLLDEKDIEKEKNVILEELNMYEDSPDELVIEKLQEKIWKDNPLGYTILGEEKNIKSFTRDNVVDYFYDKYNTENIVISVAGNFEVGEMMDKLNTAFKITAKPKVNSVNVNFDIPQYTSSFCHTEKDIEQMHIALAYPSIKIDDVNYFSFSILNSLFGGEVSSRLFQKIREDLGLVYSIYSYNSAFTDTGLFTVYAALAKNNVEQVVKVIDDEIKNLFIDRITDYDLIKAKEQLKSGFLLGLESTSARMSRAGRNMILLNKVTTPDEVEQRIDEVTIERIYEVADNIFNKNAYSLSTVGEGEGLAFTK